MRSSACVRSCASPGNLSLTVSDHSANIPPFNPQRLLAEAAPGNSTAAEDAPAAEPDAEVAFVMRDMAPIMPKLKIALLTPGDEVMRARARGRRVERHRPPIICRCAAHITGIKLAYAGDGTVDPYAGFEARIVPENITVAAQDHDPDNWRQWQVNEKLGRGEEG